MRIGIYCGDVRPESGGGFTFVKDLLGAFSEIVSTSEHSYVMFSDPATVQVIGLTLDASNVTVVPVPWLSRPAKWLLGLKYFSPLFRWTWRRKGPVERAARLQDIQLLWFVGVGAYECPDIPYVANLWDLQHRCQPFFPEVSAAGMWDKREQFYGYFLRRAAFCITGTETGKREVQSLYQLEESRVRTLPLPTPTFALGAAPSKVDARSHFKIDKDYVFYPAQFWPHKNHANLILALKRLKEQYGLEIVLALCGSDKGNLSFIRSFVDREGMTQQVRFLGFVSAEEMIALYRQAVALTFVTYFGPDNLPPLEAFALGCPVIASAVEGSREQYKDAVVYVDPSDPESISRAIWNVYSDKELRQQLVHSGLRRASEWTATDYVKGMLDLFSEFSAVRRNWL